MKFIWKRGWEFSTLLVDTFKHITPNHVAGSDLVISSELVHANLHMQYFRSCCRLQIVLIIMKTYSEVTFCAKARYVLPNTVSSKILTFSTANILLWSKQLNSKFCRTPMSADAASWNLLYLKIGDSASWQLMYTLIMTGMELSWEAEFDTRSPQLFYKCKR